MNFPKQCLMALLAPMIMGCNHAAQSKPANKSVEDSASIILNSNVRTVFPLFDPVNEKKWAEAWDIDIFFQSPKTVEDMVFSPKAKHHGTPGIWTVPVYDTANFIIKYVTFNDDWITMIHIYCSPINEQETKATIQYHYIALTVEGEKTIGDKLHHMYAKRMGDWREAINYYLSNHKQLKH